MQLSRALFLSSERTRYHGAYFVSVAASMASRAREYSYKRRNDSKSIWLSFQCRRGSFMRATNRRCCSFWPTSIQYLMRIVPPSTIYFSAIGRSCKQPPVLLGRAETHDIFHTSPVVPAPVKDYDLPTYRKMLHIALKVHLTFFAIRRARQSYDSENTRAHTFGNCANGALLPRRVAPFKNDDHTQPFMLDPILKLTEFGLQPTELLFHIPFFLGAPLFPPLWLGTYASGDLANWQNLQRPKAPRSNEHGEPS